MGGLASRPWPSEARTLALGLYSSQTVHKFIPLPTDSPGIAPRLQAAVEALASPLATRGQLIAAYPPTALTATNWRLSRAMRESHWCCPNCSSVVSKAVTTCITCGAAHRDMTLSTPAAEVAAVTADAQSSSYGRSLRFTAGREQMVGEGVGALPSSSNYASLVFARNADIGRTDERNDLIEARPTNGVIRLDGWLALQTAESANPVRLFGREDVRSSFAPHPNVEALCTEWVQDHARRIMVADGVEVQVQPMGGWWRRVPSELTEQHIHIVRSIMGMQFEHMPSAKDALQLVLRGPLAPAAYDRVASVASSLFAQMACRERGPLGRARRSQVAPPTMAALAANGVRIPRYVVAMLMQPCISKAASRKLAVIERARVVTQRPALHVVCYGVLPNGSNAYLALVSTWGGCDGCQKWC